MCDHTLCSRPAPRSWDGSFWIQGGSGMGQTPGMWHQSPSPTVAVGLSSPRAPSCSGREQTELEQRCQIPEAVQAALGEGMQRARCAAPLVLGFKAA